ncbi:MAG: FimB/Mfa2 family fimbrial subunit [Prevotella sp.]|nr:FimB/Mfa2 family fimbrial subunit [Prevotella sp.]
MKHICSLFTACLLLFAACEKPLVVGGNDDDSHASERNLFISVSGFNVVPFDVSRASADLKSHCSRLNFVVYQNGKKVKGVNQVASQADFGQVALSVDEGQYDVLVLAHSANGNPVVSDPEKIQFTNDDGFTDTFFSYEKVNVGGEGSAMEVVLDRCTAMFRLITTDNVPDDVVRMRFYYTGGSGALDVVTGYGCVNSKQVVFFDITDDMHGKPLRLETYTFPKSETSSLKMLMQAYNSNNDILYEHELTDVPIQMNRVTEYTGRFFDSSAEGGENEGGKNGGEGGAPSLSIKLNTEWGGTLKGSF